MANGEIKTASLKNFQTAETDVKQKEKNARKQMKAITKLSN